MPLALATDDKDDREAPASAPAFSKDLTPLLDQWRGEETAARLVQGDDGRLKMHLRIESGLGLIQLDAEGSPDPATDATWLSQLRRLDRLDLEQAKQLDREARLVARRYLGWFLLEQWNRVIRDANHHLAAIDLIRRNIDGEVATSQDRWMVYAIMMRARAESARQVAQNQAYEALHVIKRARRRIVELRSLTRQPWLGVQEVEALDHVLRRLRRQLHRQPAVRLPRLIQKAVRRDDFERACKLSRMLRLDV
jgi:hypothetical protein